MIGSALADVDHQLAAVESGARHQQARFAPTGQDRAVGLVADAPRPVAGDAVLADMGRLRAARPRAT